MKTVPFVCLLLFVTTSAMATPPGASTVAELDESDDTGEAAALTVSSAFALVTVGTIAAGSPSYWLGGVGIAAGITALAMGLQDNAPYQMGLYVAGASAIASGLISFRYRHVLNDREKHARLEPAWTHGSPGLALVVDF